MANQIENINKLQNNEIDNIKLLKEKIVYLEKSKKKYKTELINVYNLEKKIGIDDLDIFEKIKDLYDNNKEKYRINNLYELLKSLINILDEISEFLLNNGFNTFDEVIEFINKNKKSTPSFENTYITQYVSDMINYHLYDNIVYNIIEKKKNTKKCLYNTCINFIPNKYLYCYHHCDIEMKKNKNNINIKNENSKELDLNSNSWISYKNYLKDSNDLQNIYYDKWIFSLINNKKNNKIQKKVIRKEYTKRDQDQTINGILDKLSKKVKNTEFYKIKIERNKTLIKLYSFLNNNKNSLDNDEKLELQEVEKIRIDDRNKSRFDSRCKIYDKIYNNKKIFSSNYIILPSYIDTINENYIDLFIHKLELLCDSMKIEDIKNINNISTTFNQNTEKSKSVSIFHKLDIKNIKEFIPSNIN